MGRQCTTGAGRKPKQYKRTSVDYTHKLQLLKQISSWGRQRKQIELMCSQRKGKPKNLRNIGEAIVLPRDVEEYIVLWLNSMRRGGYPVSAQMLQF
ncbi:Hypothetical protein PHPALM_17995 [Phytophthora palmivora]|uniref:HTH CENPB-type domain-containing protein n=1 Tax=Phytophthora palmivora TaxID=4796 RepID=A0A2P4XKX1_9STRA|nr:Hypothetical protein PHPALM_17995 [Phytophthora palmivora]